MKRDIKINIDHLEAMTKKLASYLGDVAKIRLASQRFLKVLQDQQSTAYQNLAEEWRTTVVQSAELLQYRITETYRLLERYISTMGLYIGPADSSKMMRVDRNDIWWNLDQVQSHLWGLNTIYGSTYTSIANYKNTILNRLFYDQEEWQALEDKEQREKQYREANFAKMQDMRIKLLQEITQHIDQNLWKLYNENIKPFENEDDNFASEADTLYDEYKTFADGAKDVANYIAGFCEGAWDATVGTIDGLLTLVLWTFPPTRLLGEVGLLGDGIEERLKGMDAGILGMYTDPIGTIEAIGQTTMDTYDEEGMDYVAGGLAVELIGELAGTKGMGKVIGCTDEIADVAKTAGKIDNAIDVLDDAPKVLDVLDDAPKVMDEVVEGGTPAPIKYSPINPCDEISREVTESFSGATFTQRVLTEDTVMYRVSGGNAKEVGSYMSMTPQGGGLQSQLDLALNPAWGNTTENVTKVVVPRGTTIYEGIAAPQNIYDSLGNVVGTLPGGGNQVYIPKVEAGWFQ